MAVIPEIPTRFRRPIFAATHLALTVAAYGSAYALRFDLQVPASELATFVTTLPILVVLRLLAFERLRMHRGYWRYTGIHDVLDLGMAVTLGTAGFLLVMSASGHVSDLSRAVIALDWMLSIFFGAAVRLATRCVREHRTFLRSSNAPTGPRTIVIGAGETTEILLRQFSHRGRNELEVVGLVDDAPATRGMWLHGIPVLGTTEDLPALVERHEAELLVIAVSSATGPEMRRIIARCADTGVRFKSLPSIPELLSGSVSFGNLRDVQVEDLLGRAPIKLALDSIKRDLDGLVVLVTGGAGSIGSELARQIARHRPGRLIVLDQAESPLYFVHLELVAANPDVEIVPIIADITDEARLTEIFARYQPDYVVHAAAYKHVPMMECNITEAVRNNVFGTLQVVRCAARYRAKKFVLISTDKAVNPTSIMGATKRIGEHIVLRWPEARGGRTDFRVVRFGNVLGSDGSVVPLFKRQLAAGGPLTVTHPGITRYFMTIPEAVQLVLQAAALDEARGRICMLEMGEPVRIVDLAEQLIRLSGLQPHRDVQIVFTGLRPGEKMHEELTGTTESTVATAVEKIRVVERHEHLRIDLRDQMRVLERALVRRDADQLIDAVQALVPEYAPQRVMDRAVKLPFGADLPSTVGDMPAALRLAPSTTALPMENSLSA